jgi:hypothetical protein
VPATAPKSLVDYLANASYSALWLLLIGLGFVVLLSYQTTAGDSLSSPSSWPANTALQRSETGNTVLLFLHPKCPCSRASLHKFEQLLSHHTKVRAYAIFIKPLGADASWNKTELTEQANAIANLVTIEDNNQAEMLVFKAATSGLVLNYDQRGDLNFVGGITPGRGHEGDCQGSELLDKILAYETSPKPALTRSDVYGCPLEAINLELR